MNWTEFLLIYTLQLALKREYLQVDLAASGWNGMNWPNKFGKSILKNIV